jgi:hypothetical protein
VRSFSLGCIVRRQARARVAAPGFARGQDGILGSTSDAHKGGALSPWTAGRLSPARGRTIGWFEHCVRPDGRASGRADWGHVRSGPGRVAAKPRFLHRDSRFVPEKRHVMKAKARVRAWLRARSHLFWLLVPLYRSAQRLRCRCLRFVFRPPTDRFLRPHRLLSVPPSAIEYKTLLPGSALRGRGCE